jgi:hypothetical protein
MLLTAKATKDAEDLVKASRVVGNDLTGMELVRPPVSADDEESEFQIRSEEHVPSAEEEEEEEEATSQRSGENNAANRVLDVSEVDIARIVPRVISHRVRLRDGPEDELLSSALFGATFEPPPEILQAGQGEGEVTLDSVKKVLVQILSDV